MRAFLVILLWVSLAWGQAKVTHQHGVHVFPDGIEVPNFTGALTDKGGQEYNVKAYGAVMDGATDDGPAIQAAADAAAAAGGGTVLLPACGTYFLQRGIELADFVGIRGQGRCSILRRGMTVFPQTTYTTGCVQTTAENQRAVIRNKRKDCDGTGIFLRDFAIDGSAVISLPCTSCAAGPSNASVMIVFSAVTDLRIQNITITNAPQDAIFIKNAGARTLVQGVTINGHNMLWGNGSGINVEMRTTGNIPGTIDVSGNTIISSGPNFCDADLSAACTVDADCTTCVGGTCSVGVCVGGVRDTHPCTGVCGNGAGPSSIPAISMTWVDATVQAPRGIIARNRIETTDRHLGINLSGADGAIIADNYIRAFDSGTALAKIFLGIQLTANATHPFTDVVLANNVIIGGAVSGDKRGILVDDSASAGKRVSILGNMIRDKFVTGGESITLRGVADAIIEANIVNNNTSTQAIGVGSGTTTTTDVKVEKNLLSDITAGSTACLVLRNTTRTVIQSNTFRNASRGVEFQTATVAGTTLRNNSYVTITTPLTQTVTDATLFEDERTFNTAFASLPTANNGSLLYCNNCTYDGTTGVCNTAGTGAAGRFALRENGNWCCQSGGALTTCQ